MSLLSPAALAVLGNLQAASRQDSTDKAGTDGAFLALLESGSESFSAGTQPEQSLVETLYEKDDEPQPVAVAQPVATQVEPSHAEMVARPAVKNSAPEKPQEAPKATKRNDDVAPAKPAPKSKPAKQDDEVQPAKDAAPQEPSASTPPVVKPAGEADVPTDAADSVAQKLRAKITELSDLLSMLAGMMGITGQAQLTVTRTTQMTITQVSLLSGSQFGLQADPAMLDLSDRMDQLMAAISANQGLQPSVGQSLTTTISSFQSVIFSFTAGDGSFDADAFLAKCSAAQTSLADSMQALSLNAATPPDPAKTAIDVAQLNEGMQKLSQWIGEVQSVVKDMQPAPRQVEQAALPNIVSQPGVLTADAKAPVADAAPEKLLDDSILSAGKVTAPAAQAVAANAVQPVVTATPQQQAVAAVTEVNVGAGANTSQNNGGQGGGDKPAAQTFISPASATTASTQSAAASGVTTFGKALKTASSNPAPVPEQVAFNIKTAVKDGASKIQIHLDPVELGKLHIKIDLASDGTAKGIVITADQKSTLDLLQRDARGLEQALADAGIKTDSGSLSFNLRGGDQNQQDEARQGLANYKAQTPEEDELAPLAVISRSYVINASDGLDIQI